MLILANFICPNCKLPLTKKEGAYVCKNNHSFDISKEGYVNLLLSQASSLKRHGDDKIMVRARRDFLNRRYYEILRDDFFEAVKNNVKPNATIVDVGCGEGYYTQCLTGNGDYNIFGIDISKEALKYASKLIKKAEFAVSSAFNLPFSDKSVDCITNIFAPSAYEEFYRVLKDDGLLIKVVPLEQHLFEMKCVLYKNPYKNKPEIKNDKLFKLISEKELKYQIKLNSNIDISNLFKMTPYYYKTGEADAQNLLALEEFTTTVHFNIEVYKKIK